MNFDGCRVMSAATLRRKFLSLLAGVALLGFTAAAQAVVIGYESYLKGLSPDANGVYVVAPGTVLEYRLAIELGATEWDSIERGDDGSDPIAANISSYSVTIQAIETLLLQFGKDIDEALMSNAIAPVETFNADILGRDASGRYLGGAIYLSPSMTMYAFSWGRGLDSGYGEMPAVQLVVYRDGRDALDLEMPNTDEEASAGRIVIYGLSIPLRADIDKELNLTLSVPKDGIRGQYLRQPAPNRGERIDNVRFESALLVMQRPSTISIKVTPPRLTTLALEAPSPSLNQVEAGQPVTGAFTLTALDQFGALIGVDATLTLTAAASEDATISGLAESLSGLSAAGLELSFQITPAADRDTVVTLEVSVGEIVATATITVLAAATPVDELTLVNAAGDSMIALMRPAAGETTAVTLTLRALAAGNEANFDDAVTVETSIVSGTGTVMAMPSTLTMISIGGETIDIEIALEGEEALEILVRVTAGTLEATAMISVPAAAPRLAKLLLNGASAVSLSLAQVTVNQPVTAMLTLSALDQFGAPVSVDATLTLTAAASEGATISGLAQTLSGLPPQGLALSFTITPNEDMDAVVTLEVSADGVMATATIAVEAVDREIAALELRSISATLTQTLPEDDLTAVFELNGIDNYGDRIAVEEATITFSVTLSPVDEATATLPPALSALTATGTSIEVELTEFKGMDFELTLEAKLENAAGKNLIATVSTNVDAAEPRKASALTLMSEQAVFILSRVSATLTVNIDLRLLDQYGDGIAGPEGFIPILDFKVVAGRLTVIEFKRSTTTAIPKAGTSLTLTLRLDENMDASVTLNAAGIIDGVALEPAELTLQTRTEEAVLRMLTLTAVEDEVVQSTPGAELTADFELRLIDSYDEAQDPREHGLRLTAALSGAMRTTTPRVVSYEIDTGFALVRVEQIMLDATEDATLTLTAAVSEQSFSAQAQVLLRAAAPRALATLAIDVTSTLNQAAPFADLQVSISLSALDQYMAQFAAVATLTASVGGGAMIVVMAAGSTRTSEAAELTSAVAIEKTALTETLTIRLAPATDADADADA